MRTPLEFQRIRCLPTPLRLRSPRRATQLDPQRRLLRLEPLEDRRMLSARAIQAVNAFGLDVYEQLQREEGNLFFSPLSVATGLAMAYAGAAGQTAAEMQEVLRLGDEPGVHASFNELLTSIDALANPAEQFEISVANALWPRLGLNVKDGFLNTIETDYQGHVEEVDFGNPEAAKEIINDWVAEQTRGKIEQLVDELSPLTAAVLTNSIYFKGLWENPFDTRRTFDGGKFRLRDGTQIETTYMVGQAFALREIEGYQVLEMPLAGADASMVFILQVEQDGANTVTTQLIAGIDEWFTAPRGGGYHDVLLPKFETTVSTGFAELLQGLGMPAAFSPTAADFSAMVEQPVYISDVFHKATLEVNEQGTEAAAATEVDFALCFAAGTPVLTPEGEKPIEQLKAGDYVLARDETNVEGALEPKPIERTLNGHAEIVELHVGGQMIRTTAPHPFFVQGRGWTPAAELRSGDRLSTDVDGWIELEKVVNADVAVPVHNLRVADHRTYFVGRRSAGFGLWVHNDYGLAFEAARPFHFMIRDNTTSTIMFMGRIDDPTQLENDLAPKVLQVSADFDEDGDVDGADFLLQQRGYGTPAPLAGLQQGDANGDRQIDAEDVQTWESAFVQSHSSTTRPARGRYIAPTRRGTEAVDAAIPSMATGRSVDVALDAATLSDQLDIDDVFDRWRIAPRA